MRNLPLKFAKKPTKSLYEIINICETRGLYRTMDLVFDEIQKRRTAMIEEW